MSENKQTHASAWNNKGNALAELGRYEEALEAYEKAIKINPEHASAWINKGIALDELGGYEEAIEAYEKAIKINPEHASAWNNKGIALVELERYEEAVKAYEKAIKINPEHASAWNNKGNALVELERYEEAVKAYEKAIKINPEHASAWNNKGNALVELERYEEAVKAYEKAIKINPEHALAYSNSGDLLFRLGNLDGASKKAKEALKRNKNLVSALNLQGRIEIEEKNYAAANKSFKKAIYLDMGNPRLLLWDAYANYLKTEFSSDSEGKKYEEEIVAIIRCLEKVDSLTKRPKRRKEIRAYTLYFLGSFYFKSNDVLAAKNKLQDCIRLKSKSPIETSARELLGNIWDYRIRPPWWRWWLDSPLHKWSKRITFFFLSLLSSALLLLHPFIPVWFPRVQVSWYLYGFLVALLIIILASPSIERIRAKDFEVELRSPPPFEHVLSPMMMEEKIKEIEKKYAQKR